jgi:hypothetical protein
MKKDSHPDTEFVCPGPDPAQLKNSLADRYRGQHGLDFFQFLSPL